MNEPLFTGVCTALVTPFENNEINYTMLERLLDRQIDAGIQAIVIAGTTGEGATLSDIEKVTLIGRCKEYVGNRCLIIGGTGSNNTVHSLELSIAAEKVGADGLLVVSPYYNKATPAGIIMHYQSICQAVTIPVIIYNVPSRTGLDIPIQVYKELSTIQNIAGIKEANADITRITKIRNQCGYDFPIWTGNDDQIVPVMSMGGTGVISVLSNLYPLETIAMCHAAQTNDFCAASKMQCQFQDLIDALFCEVNPIPIKAAMRELGFDCGGCRLPLCDISKDALKKLKACIK